MDEDISGMASQAAFGAGGMMGGAAGHPDRSLIYNTTFQVTWQFHNVWLQWMLDIHIPEILGTGCFTKHQLVRLLETDETDGPVYAVQYYTSSSEEYSRFVNCYQEGFKQAEHKKWGGTIFSFSSLMQIVH